jgi:hypothetical protein
MADMPIDSHLQFAKKALLKGAVVETVASIGDISVAGQIAQVGDHLYGHDGANVLPGRTTFRAPP